MLRLRNSEIVDVDGNSHLTMCVCVCVVCVGGGEWVWALSTSNTKRNISKALRETLLQNITCRQSLFHENAYQSFSLPSPTKHTVRKDDNADKYIAICRNCDILTGAFYDVYPFSVQFAVRRKLILNIQHFSTQNCVELVDIFWLVVTVYFANLADIFYVAPHNLLVISVIALNESHPLTVDSFIHCFHSNLVPAIITKRNILSRLDFQMDSCNL